MKRSIWAALQHQFRLGSRTALAALPTPVRFATYRGLIDCEPLLDEAFQLKIADTQDELEACFSLLHNAYVASGFMRPHPSGLRVTPYHALPTTTTLCAKMGDRVVGTLSIVREGVFGFPMQSAFDITAVRAKEGRIAEISALAVHPAYRKTGGAILFPLMKFMYEYCTRYFDTRHLVIAVNPNKIEMYESLLFFRRLESQVVEKYDFANGAPAVGATLDLHEAPELFRRAYAHKSPKRNLHRYFVDLTLPQIRFPPREWNTSNDPVLTPALVDYFFNQRTKGFEALSERKKLLLHSIYAGPAWEHILPPLEAPGSFDSVRRHPRYTLQCRATLTAVSQALDKQEIMILEISAHGFKARAPAPLLQGQRWSVIADLASGVQAQVEAEIVHQGPSEGGHVLGFSVERPDAAWERCLAWLQAA